MKKTNLISENDKVFILAGEDDEIYFVDDLQVITKLEAKVDELKGMDETEIIKYLLPIVNPERYKSPQNGQ